MNPRVCHSGLASTESGPTSANASPSAQVLTTRQGISRTRLANESPLLTPAAPSAGSGKLTGMPPRSQPWPSARVLQRRQQWIRL